MTKQELINFEKKIAERFDNGELPYLIHLSGGNEEQLIDIFKEVKKGDYIFSTHRSHYHYLLAPGAKPEVLEQKILNGKSMFVFDRNLNFFSSSIVAATPSIAAGVAWALKRKKSSKKVWCFIGDGAEDEGHFTEAVRYVDGFNLPCTFIIEDNDRSVSAGKKERRGTDIEYKYPKCVRRYHYKPTYPHGGSGSGKWLTFKKEADIIKSPSKASSDILTGTYTKNIKYFDAVKLSMELLAAMGCVFVGYNVRHGSAYGSLKNIPEEQRLETPLAENLMAGLAMGMSLEGFRPVLFFERHEFVLNAIDAIVNTLDIIDVISDGNYRMPVIIKAVQGSYKPFYAGLTHTRNLTKAFRELVSFPVYEPKTAEEVITAYRLAFYSDRPTMISELKSLY